MEKTVIITWLAGYVAAAAMIFADTKDVGDTGERILGSLLLGVLSWIYVLVAAAARFLRRGGKGKGGSE